MQTSQQHEKSIIDINDYKWVLQARRGNTDVLRSLIRAFKPIIYHFSKKYYIPGADLEDLKQEAIIGLYKAISTYRPDTNLSFRRFAARCIRANIITAVKTASRRKHEVLTFADSINRMVGDQDKTEMIERLEDKSLDVNVEQALLGKEKFYQLRDFLRTALSDYEYIVIALHTQNYSRDEIVQITNTSYKSVDNALQRIKRKIRRDYLSPPNKTKKK